MIKRFDKDSRIEKNEAGESREIGLSWAEGLREGGRGLWEIRLKMRLLCPVSSLEISGADSVGGSGGGRSSCQTGL